MCVGHGFGGGGGGGGGLPVTERKGNNKKKYPELNYCMGMGFYPLETSSVSPICFHLTQVMAVHEVAQVMTAPQYMKVKWGGGGGGRKD